MTLEVIFRLMLNSHEDVSFNTIFLNVFEGIKQFNLSMQFRKNRLETPFKHTGQCKRTGDCYNELVVAFYSTGGGVKGKKSIPVDFIIYL